LKKQENFIQRINDIGGCAGFVRRGEDVARILTGQGCTVLKDYPKERIT